MWAGGYWDPAPSDSTDTTTSTTPTPPVPGQKRNTSYGPIAELGDHGLVAGRFLPFHRGHQYLIDFARRSSKRLTIAILIRPDDPVPAGQRLHWIRRHVSQSQVEVHEIATTLGESPDPAKFKQLIAPHISGVTHFYTSELAYRPIADALGATFVPVDPSRSAIPISGTAIRANLMDNFRYLVPSTRPYFVRRIAVVGAESTGKSTLCARLKEEFGALVVPEWTRVLVEGGVEGDLQGEHIQLAARSQIASEDALAAQVVGTNAGILLCDTELRTIGMWANRLFHQRPPTWINDQIVARPYDLHLLCAPDIPYKGPPERDLPKHRRDMHDTFVRLLAKEHVVELTGSRDERFKAAADAIISLFAPGTLLSKRGAVML